MNSPLILLRKWHVWNPSTGQWTVDGNCHCLAAPSVIHVLGRHQQALATTYDDLTTELCRCEDVWFHMVSLCC